jgi:hypothetical protein
MVNKINQEWWPSINATPTRPSNKDRDQEPKSTPNKNRTGHKAEREQDNHLIIHERK